MKPRDSIPRTFSTEPRLKGRPRASRVSRKRTASPKIGVMSLKTIPVRGKSGTSRMTRLSLSSTVLLRWFTLVTDSKIALLQLRSVIIHPNGVDTRVLRALPQSGLQGLQAGIAPAGHRLDRAVGEVPDEADQAEPPSRLDDKVPESHSPDH